MPLNRSKSFTPDMAASTIAKPKEHSSSF